MNPSPVSEPDVPGPKRKPLRHGDFDYLRDVTDVQWRVIEALVAGNSVREAARLTDTPPATIYLWLRTSVAFNTALNRQRQIEWGHNVDLLRAADVLASLRLLDLLEDADPDTIIAYLRARNLGKIDTRPTGPTDPDAAIDEEVETRFRAREREILDEGPLARAAEHAGEIGPRREAVREVVEDQFRRDAQKAALSFDPGNSPAPGPSSARSDVPLEHHSPNHEEN